MASIRREMSNIPLQSRRSGTFDIFPYYFLKTLGGLEMIETIYQLLHYLSITGNYRGFKQTVVALKLILENEDWLLNIGELCREVARILGCPECTVERNIRTVINRVWRNCPKRLIEIAGFHMYAPPNVSEFLAILSNHVRRTCRISIEK
jgi:hypothetical protein